MRILLIDQFGEPGGAQQCLAEAAVGLAIIISVFRTRETLNVDRVNLLKL